MTWLWITAIPISLSILMIALSIHERGMRKGMEEAEKLYAPILQLATKWAEVHLAYEKRNAVAPPESEED